MAREPAAVRLYRLVLRFAPEDFREHDADTVAHVFAELHRAACASGGTLAGVRALVAEGPGLIGLLWFTWRATWQAPRRRVPRRRRDTMLGSLLQDIGAAARSLRRVPGFSLIAIITLALGVGANTAIFGLVRGVLMRPLAFPAPDRLVVLGEGHDQGAPTDLDGTSPASFFDWKRGARSVTGFAAWSQERVTVTGFGDPESVIATSSVGGLLDVLGVRPLLGRTLREFDETSGAERVAVLSHTTWQRLFGGDREVIGRRIVLSGQPTTIVGVMPRDFRFPDASTAVWLPYAWTPEFRANRDQYFLVIMARLRDGATLEGLRAEMAAVAAELRRDQSKYNTALRIHARPLQETMVEGARTRLLLFMGAVGCVLLITCANLANLMLARATTRRREIAVRQALGAARSRIVRQLLTESAVLALAGGVLAIGIGQVLMRWLVAAHRDVLPRIEDVRLDGTVLSFTLLIALVAGMAFGIVPALQLATGRSADALRESERGGGVRLRGRGALVVAELALALMLLTGAGLLLRSSLELTRVNPGFDTRRLLTFSANFGDSSVVRTQAALAALRALPGVRAVAVTSQVPITGRGIGAWFNRYAKPVPAGDTPPGEPYRVVSPDYFQTVGIPLVRGRLLTADDRRGSNPSVVINEALAHKYWPTGDPIGEEIYLGAPDNRLFDRATIVGVVGNTRDAGLRADPLPEVFIPHAVMPYWGYFSYVVRTSGEPTSLVTAVRRRMRELEPGTALRNMQTMDDILRDSVANDRLALILLGTFAAVALLMATIGVFGVIAFLVSRRTRELGIRLALGAPPSRVRSMVILQGARLALGGVVIGLVAALALNRVIRGLLFGVTSTDPLTYVAVAATLLLVGVLASWLPARRATRVDPLVALREG